jgi:hypothetical protein
MDIKIRKNGERLYEKNVIAKSRWPFGKPFTEKYLKYLNRKNVA